MQDRIYVVDETGIRVNPKDQSKIVTLEGRRQVCVRSSARKEGLSCLPCLFFPGNECSRNLNWVSHCSVGWSPWNWLCNKAFILLLVRKVYSIFRSSEGVISSTSAGWTRILDVSFMKPFNLYYEEELRDWLRRNPGKVVTLFRISGLYGGADLSAANMHRNLVARYEWLLRRKLPTCYHKGYCALFGTWRGTISEAKYQHSFTGSWDCSFINWW
jgi:hypothetical protein